jgi:Concanavalin A-like lectin/glucanases superfamily
LSFIAGIEGSVHFPKSTFFPAIDPTISLTLVNIRFLLLVLVLSSSLAAQEIKPSPTPVPDVDPIVKASAYGDKCVWSYSGSDPLPWTMFRPKDFGSAKINFNSNGVTSVGTVPPPGIHPRIFFSPEDLPTVRKRLKEDPAAQAAWKLILAYSHALNLTYDEKADYAQPDWANGSFHVHGRTDQVMRIGGYGANREDYYGLLSSGKPTETFENPKSGGKSRPSGFFFVAAVEAFRCLIDDDAAGAKKLAAAVETSVKFEQERRAKEDKPVKPGQPPRPSTPRYDASQLGLIYDFIYNWMTPDQKKLIHDELVLLSAWVDGYGTFSHAETSRSNWATFSYQVWDTVAIEGEPGFNDLKFLGLYRGWRNFLTYSFFNSGCAYEAEGKLLFGLDAVVAFDRIAPKYGLPLLSQHPLIRDHYGKFTALSILPTQDNRYVIFDILGGMGGKLCTPQDLVVAHYIFPNDKTIDFVYRSMVGEDFRSLPMPSHSWNNLITDAIFATTYHPENTPEKLGIPLTFFCGQRALMMTRSSWDTNATLLTMHVRGASGGHPYADRNGIMIAAQGRPWVTIPFKDGKSWQCSTVTFNGCEQSSTTPGRVVDFVDNPLATFMVGDSKYCWDWVWGGADKNKRGQAVTRKDVDEGNIELGKTRKSVELTFNDFAYTKVDVLDYSQPMKYSGHWLGPDGTLRSYYKMVNNPVIKSFRTAGLVRGVHPYVLVIDDIQHDALPALYEWHLSLPSDLIKVEKQPSGAQVGDFFLAAKESLDEKGLPVAGSPLLLVRVLDQKGRPEEPRIIDVNPQVLTLGTRAVTPAFKVLIHALRAGDPIPQTTPLRDGKIEINFPDQKDVLNFTDGSTGKTDLTIVREGQEIIAIKKAAPKLNDPDSDLLTSRQLATASLATSLSSFNPESISGLVASWDVSKPDAGGYPAVQTNISQIPSTNTWTLPGLSGTALGISNKGVSVPLDFKTLCPRGFTLSFWVKWLKTPTVSPKEKSADGPYMGSLVSVNGGNGFALNLVQGGLNFQSAGNTDLLPSATLFGWTHYALTTDGQSETLYVNGQPLLTNTLTKPLNPGNKIDLAGGGYGGFSGAYQDLRIYNRTLSADEILKCVMKATLPKSP